ncbi:hypothetical protein FGIG_04774 [Fasciola gigantica]|uniref:Uncharacterized protein n=1 Tax=Fasciola gigantica TaxID=46835 RepID=A0A504YLT4_FASGI|nr:hypothetical protein FGIG_04774 [Fasciola gigantica]
MKCVYKELVQNRDGVCGDTNWQEHIHQSRLAFYMLPQSMCVDRSQLDEILQKYPLPGLIP